MFISHYKVQNFKTILIVG